MNNIINHIMKEILQDEVEDNIANIIVGGMPILNEGLNNHLNEFEEVLVELEGAGEAGGDPHDVFPIHARDAQISNSNYFEEIIPQYTDEQFRAHFRMSREIFEELNTILTPRVNNLDNIPLRKKVLLTIWILATPDSFRSVADRFGLPKSVAHVVFKEIVQILADLMPMFIRWPTANECEVISNVFARRSGYPGVVGAIDCCHIQIRQPPHNANDYYNRKNTHSVILQGTCDHSGKFTDVFIGRPGRAHDANVFRSSPLYAKLMNAGNPLLPQNKHLLGDAAYPLSVNVLTPFRDNGHLTAAQVNYNVIHASQRSIIERAFGLLKAKFRRLRYLDVHSIRMANLIIAASCTLHNFILIHGNTNIFDNIYVQNDNDNPVNDEGENNHEIEAEVNVNAISKRDTIMNLLIRNE